MNGLCLCLCLCLIWWQVEIGSGTGNPSQAIAIHGLCLWWSNMAWSWVGRMDKDTRAGPGLARMGAGGVD